MRLVLDTDVMVAAIRSDSGASRHLVLAVLRRQVTMLLSVPLAIEYQAVMSRREHLTASGLDATELGTLLDALAAVSEPVRLAFLWRPTLRDPDDDMVLETAMNGRADFLATFNLRDFRPAAAQFGMVIGRPADALRALAGLRETRP